MTPHADTTRALISITGTDAEPFLQGLITNDMALLKSQPAIYAAMLSPQGKWQHDFIIIAQHGGYYLDCLASHAAALLKKLNLYKLRAQVTLTPGSHLQLYYAPPGTALPATLAFADPRHSALPARIWSETAPQHTLSAEDYTAIRFAHAIPEGGQEITENETALDAGLGELHGVSFSKGCYVGQEITARMHYKSIARKGFFAVAATGALPAAPSAILYGGKKIAELRSSLKNQGMAYGRFEDIAPALNAGELTCDGQSVLLSTPAWQSEKWGKFLASANESAGATANP